MNKILIAVFIVDFHEKEVYRSFNEYAEAANIPLDDDLTAKESVLDAWEENPSLYEGVTVLEAFNTENSQTVEDFEAYLEKERLIAGGEEQEEVETVASFNDAASFARTEEVDDIQITAEEVVTEEATTEEVVTEEATTEEVVTEEATTEEVVTEEATTEEVVTEEATTEEVVTEEATTEEAGTSEEEPVIGA